MFVKAGGVSKVAYSAGGRGRRCAVVNYRFLRGAIALYWSTQVKPFRFHRVSPAQRLPRPDDWLVSIRRSRIETSQASVNEVNRIAPRFGCGIS